jgi:uncharacterized OB-fold protein
MSSALPEFWRLSEELLELTGGKCRNCGKINFPQRKICAFCGAHGNFEKVKISRRGKVHTYVVAHALPSGVEAPTPLAVVDTDDGARLVGFVTECEPNEIRWEMPVEVVLRKVGELDGRVNYGFKFRPIRFNRDAGK